MSATALDGRIERAAAFAQRRYAFVARELEKRSCDLDKRTTNYGDGYWIIGAERERLASEADTLRVVLALLEQPLTDPYNHD